MGTRAVDAHTPFRPQAHRHNVVSAIMAGFGCSHFRGLSLNRLLIVNPIGEGAVPLDSPPRVKDARPKPTPLMKHQMQAMAFLFHQLSVT